MAGTARCTLLDRASAVHPWIRANQTDMRIRMIRCVHAWRCGVPKTVQIRDVDDEVYAALARRAAEAGITVPELLRRHATRLAARPTMTEWLDRTRRRSTDITTDDVLEALDELRGTWPDAGR
jgi:antitoxin FitA